MKLKDVAGGSVDEIFQVSESLNQVEGSNQSFEPRYIVKTTKSVSVCKEDLEKLKKLNESSLFKSPPRKDLPVISHFEGGLSYRSPTGKEHCLLLFLAISDFQSFIWYVMLIYKFI